MRKLQRIVCPIDFSEFSIRAYRYALSVAYRYRARLFVQHVVELWKYPYADVAAYLGDYDETCRILRKGGEEQLQQFLKTSANDEVQPEYVVDQGMAPDCILAFAEAQKADLIVMGTHGRRGFDRLVLGSVTERVMRNASCPLLAVNKPLHDLIESDKLPSAIHLSRILFCTDFSENSRQALSHALSLRTEYNAELTLLHVVEDMRDSAKLEQALATTAAKQLRDLIPQDTNTNDKCKITTMVRVGTAYRQVLQVALETQTDLVVMAVRGRGSLDLAMFGSTTHRILQFGTCPVFLVHV
ncbi:MAG TPA: universal stress protein [Acidobacteriota bacterium]|nr:universal stress protein [Acidobacteriota bacterium]